MWQSFQPRHRYFIEHCKYKYKFATHKIFFKELLFNSLIINEILLILIRLLIVLMWTHAESNRQRIYDALKF